MKSSAANIALMWFKTIVSGLLMLAQPHLISERFVALFAFEFVPTLGIMYLRYSLEKNYSLALRR